jgi:hypothetical protein
VSVLVSRCMLLLLLKAIFMSVCLKRLVIFLIFGLSYVNVVHLFFLLSVFFCCFVAVLLRSICFLSVIIFLARKLLLWAILSMVCHSIARFFFLFFVICSSC